MKHGFEQAMADAAEANKVLESIAKGEEIPGLPATPAPDELPVPTPPTPPAPAPAPVVKPAEVNQENLISALQEALAAEKRKVQFEKSASGRLREQAEENKLLKEQIRTLTEENTVLKKVKPAEPVAPNGDIQSLQTDFGLDEASAARFNKMIEDRINSGVQGKLTSLGIKPGEKAVEPTAKTEPVEEKARKEDTLSPESWKVFHSMVPDFASIANYDAAGKPQWSPELTAFFMQEDSSAPINPATGRWYSFGQMAVAATRNDDPVRLAAIYNEFKAPKTARPIRPLTPKTGGGGKGPLDTKPTYSRKDVDSARIDYRNNVGTWSVEDLHKAKAVLEEYDKAEYEGRVV